MSAFTELTRSLRQLRDLLVSNPSIPVTRCAELAQLSVLVRKYPDQARQMLADTDRRDR